MSQLLQVAWEEDINYNNKYACQLSNCMKRSLCRCNVLHAAVRAMHFRTWHTTTKDMGSVQTNVPQCVGLAVLGMAQLYVLSLNSASNN